LDITKHGSPLHILGLYACGVGWFQFNFRYKGQPC